VRPGARKLAKAAAEFRTYIENNAGSIPNYGERYRNGEAISSAVAESAVTQVISKRMVKQQQMRGSPEGAHLLLQVRARVLNDDCDYTHILAAVTAIRVPRDDTSPSQTLVRFAARRGQLHAYAFRECGIQPQVFREYVARGCSGGFRANYKHKPSVLLWREQVRAARMAPCRRLRRVFLSALGSMERPGPSRAGDTTSGHVSPN